MTGPDPARGRRSWLSWGVVLAVVATLVASVVVAVRQPDSGATAQAEPLQVGSEAPSLASHGDPVPVTVSATGPDALRLVELWVDEVLVDSARLDGPETGILLTLNWVASQQGTAQAHARVVDASGRVGLSKPTLVRVVAAPSAHLVVDPVGETIADIAQEAGHSPEAVVAANPGADPADRLKPGSVVFLPPLEPIRPPPQGEGGGASIEDGVLRLDQPVDGVFLYLTVAGEVLRVPESPADLIPGDGITFDLAPHLPPVPRGDIAVEVWGRTGGDVELVATLVVSRSSLLAPATDLVALPESSPFDFSVPVKSLTATDAETVELKWLSNVPHDGVRWFLATEKPGPATALAPSGVLQNGLARSEDGRQRFSIDLSANTKPILRPTPITLLPIARPTDEVATETDGITIPDLTLLHPPGTTWAWVVPVDEAGQPVGPASEPVRIIITEAPFDPTIAPPFDVVRVDVVIPPAPNPALAECIRVVSQTPPFPAGIGSSFGFYLNPDGSISRRGGGGGTKITGTLPYTLDELGGAVYPFTACPGERGNFQWGDVGCGGDPLCHVSKGLADLGEAAQAFAEFLVDLANELSDAYNELKAWAIAQVASTICPDEVAGPCKTMINIAVDALLTSVGVPPTMPNFDDLAEVAKGELVDLAMDQMGVGGVCDAVSQAGTGKTCGELATELQNLDACSFAPKGQEDHCRELVADAKEVCDFAIESDECALLTTNAQDLVEEGTELAVEASIAAIEREVTRASMASLGFHPYSSPFAATGEHHCRWGGANNAEIICPPWSLPEAPDNLPFPLGGGDEPETPPGCRLGRGEDRGRVVCSSPPGEIVAIPEPLGQRQPIEVEVVLARNENPLPDDFACGPIYAVATNITPRGAMGEPYLPASSDFPSESIFALPDLFGLSLFLSEPNPHVEIPDDQKPPPPTELLGEAFDAAFPFGGVFATSEWKYLLEAGSYVSIAVYGECIPETHPDTYLGIAGEIPPPQPRITPGAP